jgi:hypothetical protein
MQWKHPSSSSHSTRKLRCKKRKCVLLSLSSLILINNRASNRHSDPTKSFCVLGPRSEHWPKAPLTLNPLRLTTISLATVSANISFDCIWLHVKAHSKYDISKAAIKRCYNCYTSVCLQLNFASFFITVDLRLYKDGMQLTVYKETRVGHLAIPTEAVI